MSNLPKENLKDSIDLKIKSNPSTGTAPIASAVTQKLKGTKFGITNKLTYFLGGMGVTFSFLYIHFMSYITKSDEMIKNDIEEIKKMIEKHNYQTMSNKSIKVDSEDKDSNKINMSTTPAEKSKEDKESDNINKNDKI